MKASHLNIGILHSLIGKNDGVSIVIDQTVNAMVKDMEIDLGRIHFLAAHTSPRFNAVTDEIFWHKSEIHKNIISNFSTDPAPKGLDAMIHNKAIYAKKVIARFIRQHNIDLLIAHNTSHPYNFITAVGLGYFMEELQSKGYIWPKVMVWWHDSYFEREQFSNPSPVIKKYLKYLPGTYIDGIAFINHTQPELAKRLFMKYNSEKLEAFFRDRSAVIPNTSSITWDWQDQPWEGNEAVFPEQDNYNDTFLKDLGLLDELEKRNFSIEDTAILLQHTRIVPRKKIELALDFAFELEKKFWKVGQRKCIVLLISGHSGDEQVEYKRFLRNYYDNRILNNPDSNIIMIFGEDIILSHRDIIVDKKYYKFNEIPSIIASYGGIGTYFSEVEGYGNNLLEMVSFALPVVINKYEVYKQEIEPLGFKFPSVDNTTLTGKFIDQAYEILVDVKKRNQMVRHNLSILHEKLDHRIIAEKMLPLLVNMFTKKL
jgi:glycosyltransferase involved in cell wall biosynthesis